MRQILDAGASEVETLMSQYLDPVILWAQKAGYDPKVDSKWRLKMFMENDLDRIMNGQVNFEAYMGDRYSTDMVETVRRWAKARYEMPQVVGYTPRKRYDERRRSYYDRNKPVFDINGKVQTNTPSESLFGNFLMHREIEERVNLDNAVLDETVPDIVILARDMENQAKQAVFQPIQNKNGRIELKKGSILEQLFKDSVNPNLTKDEREAATTTIRLIAGGINYNTLFNKVMLSHTDAVLTNNLGSAVSNFVGMAGLTDVPKPLIIQAAQMIRKDKAAQQLLREARITDQISLHRELLDNTSVRYTEPGLDLFRWSENQVRGVTYLAKAMQEAERLGIKFEEVVAGKTDKAKLARGAALRELRQTQGSSHRYSIRSGKVIAPGAFFLKNAAVSQMGRTLGQLRLALSGQDARPIVWNLGVRLVAGGPRMVLDPKTATIIGAALNLAPVPEDWKKQYAGFSTDLRNATRTLDFAPFGIAAYQVQSPLEAVDNLLGTNLSSKGSLVDVGAVPLSGALTGRPEPVDASVVPKTVEKIMGKPHDPTVIREELFRLGEFLGSYLPKTTFNVPVGGGRSVRTSIPMLARAANSTVHLLTKDADSIPVSDTSVRVNPAGEIIRPIAGGHGASGNILKERVYNEPVEMSNLRRSWEDDVYNNGGKVSEGTNALFNQYLAIHGRDEFKGYPEAQWRYRLEDRLAKEATQPIERELKDKIATYLESRYINAPDTNQRLESVKALVQHMKTAFPARYGKLSLDKALREAEKKARRK